jgi:LmbE family N-acetylglucosaminyl deacetylase
MLLILRMRKKLSLITLALFCFLSGAIQAQTEEQWNAAELLHEIQKLGNTSKVLYLAAHPDDENTRLISWLTNEVKANTAYLSLTRGDGGQNLIGPELREGLGVIRTHELKAARSIDGASQFFSRANDFGYSKSVEETLEFWDEEDVLHDMVWVIRNFRPDMIITRFSPEIGPRATHGHHTASAQLGLKAVKLAADETAYPNQLSRVKPWQVKQVYWNTSWWFYGDQQLFDSLMSSGEVIKVDVGGFNPLLGKSYSEIAAEARSQHKCQGFGTTGSRGELNEYLSLLWTADEVETDFHSLLHKPWSVFPNGKHIQKEYDKLQSGYSAEKPEESVLQLLAFKETLESIEDHALRKEIQKQCDLILQQMCGIFISASVNEWHAAPGDSLPLYIEIVNRSEDHTFVINSLRLGLSTHIPLPLNDVLKPGDKLTSNGTTNFGIPINHRPSQPYWLRKPHTEGMYQVNDLALLGKDFNEAEFVTTALLGFQDIQIPIEIPITYRGRDRVKGEVVEPLHVVPQVLVSLDKGVYVFRPGQAQNVEMNVRLMGDAVEGYAELNLPEGWRSEPAFYKLTLDKKAPQQSFSFQVIPPKNPVKATMGAMFKADEQVFTLGMQEIQYDHIPYTCIFPEAKADIIHLDIKVPDVKVAYVQGAGDEIPAALARMGLSCEVVPTSALNASNLSGFDAVVLGIRAYNTLNDLPLYQSELMKFVELGGTLIVQYNTSYGMPDMELGPYPLKIDRSRVTDERAPVRFVNPEHAVLNLPNKISLKDFDHWVQERGLYFPEEWDERYVPILEMADKGEEPHQGSLLVASYGKGHYVYTGLSFFRELPAGVPGAYRLFANLLAL